MEPKRSKVDRGRILNRMIILSLLFMGVVTDAIGQTYMNDKAKTYQLRSMETGKWEFHPGLYYIELHKSYSGGYWKNLVNIRWDVKKSSVGQIAPLRAEEVVLENLSSQRVQQQIDSIKPLFEEETIRSAERIVDGIYMQYESKFKEAFENIDEYTAIANDKSGGSLLEDALRIIEEKELLQAEIDYIHETGLDKQMEQAKRQLAYEEVLKKLQKLRTRSYHLAYYAYTLSKLKK